MAFFWPFGHEGQTFFDLLAKIQARRIKRSNDWGKTLFFKKNLVLFIVELSVIFFSTLIFSTLNTTLNSTLDTLIVGNSVEKLPNLYLKSDIKRILLSFDIQKSIE